TRQDGSFAEDGNITRSIAHRNAVSVLPLPVGARMSVESPRAIAGQPCACGGVGAAKLARNHSATDEWNRSNTSACFTTFTILSRVSFSRLSRLPFFQSSRLACYS